MKRTTNQKKKDVTFEVGEMVFLKLHPFQQQLVFRRARQKLANRFYGPYPMIQKIGTVACKFQLPTGTCIHPAFHISLLKKFLASVQCPLLSCHM